MTNDGRARTNGATVRRSRGDRPRPLLAASILAAGIIAATVIVANRPGAGGPSTPSGSPVSTADLSAEARARLEDLRPSLAQRCWTRPNRDGSSVPRVLLDIDLSFDEHGRVRIWSVSRSQPDLPLVTACLREVTFDFRVAPPGAPAAVSVRLPFPTDGPVPRSSADNPFGSPGG